VLDELVDEMDLRHLPDPVRMRGQKGRPARGT